MISSNDQTAVIPINANQKPRRRYQTSRKRAIYSHYQRAKREDDQPDFNALMDECDRVDAMPNDGNLNQPTHAAYIRLREQLKLFTLWYSVVFPTYFKQKGTTREQVYVLIRYSNSSIYSLLELLEQRVKQNKEHHIPIDNPIAWCREVVRREVADREEKLLRDQARMIKDTQEAREKLEQARRTTVTEVKSAQIPEKAGSRQETSKQEKPRDPSMQFAGKPRPDEMSEPPPEYMALLNVRNLRIHHDQLDSVHMKMLQKAGFSDIEAYKQAYEEKKRKQEQLADKPTEQPIMFKSAQSVASSMLVSR